MVATSGRVNGRLWTLAPALRQLLEQVDTAYPDRPKRSDGSIGDPAHQSRASDHNRNDDGMVTAIDLTDWQGGAFDVDDWARQYAVHDPAREVPHLGRADLDAGPCWRRLAHLHRRQRHKAHLHVSVLADQANNVAPWAGITRPAPAPPTPLPVNITTKGEFMASLYYRHTGDGRIARDSGGMWVHLTSAEFDADQAVARAVTGQPITLVPVYPIVWDNLATSRLNVKAMNRAASRAR
jgi:hypothetical protein